LGRVKGFIKELITGVLLVFIVSNIISYVRKPVLDSDTLPTLNVTLLDNSNYTQKHTKPLMVHFWATWCPTCKLEASNIEYISSQYEVLSIAVNSGTDAELKQFMQENALTFRVINDAKGRWSKHFKVEAFPTTFIYDAKGILSFTEVGYTTTAGLIARLKMIGL